MAAIELAKIAIMVGAVFVTVFVVTPVAQEHHQRSSESENYEAMKELLRNYHENSETDISKSFSAIFSTYECCGIKNFSYDFQIGNSTHYQRGFIFAPERPQYYALYYLIPITCCKGFDYQAELTSKSFEDHKDCLSRPNETTAYTSGCLSKIMGN